ncbi:phosphoribosylformylglycinamidine synthase subunit PurL [bacterium]|nr:phosphoribosylformylglycinamidine synthase subunit PurL [candidate division CSSED10-310 bacterium]
MKYTETIPVSGQTSDAELQALLRKMNIGMSPAEARKVAGILGRDPTRVELFIFDIEWSEHCSYKSSRATLKKYLPTDASNVILGPSEDAGIIKFTTANGREYALVFAHESHNHPSQVLPIEGAATGIGGIVRDVDCMGAHVIAVADALRFGNPSGKNAARTRWIANGVVDGIWQYGNALGVPNLAGDVYFDDSFDDNCLVNVVCLGVVPADRIIRSRVPRQAAEEDYDLILIGKPTDGSGFGGVTFASEIMNDEEKERQLGAVQVHDPFLKNILITRKANKMVWDLAFERGIPIGMKDLGGGGLACASSEICSAGGFGAVIHLDRVHTSMPDMPPEVIACSETQERFIFAVPKEFTPDVLRIYNDIWELPGEANGAGASVIGRTMKDPVFQLLYHGETVCEAPIEEVTGGIRYERQAEPIEFKGTNPPAGEMPDIAGSLEKVLFSLNGCSRYPVYRHYDTEVQGMAVLRPGESDAGVMAPLELTEQCPAGVALSVDGNPFIGEIDPYWGGAAAVAESMRNVVACGAVPRALTDCLCYGNPEKPKAFWQFVRGVRGIADAASRLWQFGTNKEPVPIVSGNVSFYNESALGLAIKPSPIVACVGTMSDYSTAVGHMVTGAGHQLLMVGRRRDEMGGSAYFREVFRVTGTQAVTIDWEQERKDMHGVVQVLRKGLATACHDIADGGCITALAEMLFSHRRAPIFGMTVRLDDTQGLPVDRFLFTETGGFILEIPEENVAAAMSLLSDNGVPSWRIGEVTEQSRIVIKHKNINILDIDIKVLLYGWFHGLEEASL